MENLIYPDGLVVVHNGATVSVKSGGGNLGNVMITPRIEYNSSNQHVDVHAELMTTNDAVDVSWTHRVVFMGPPIESVSVRWGGQAADYFYVNANILLKGGPGITTKVAWPNIADMFSGKTECLEVEFALSRMKPAGYPVLGNLFIDCKMPDWLSPH